MESKLCTQCKIERHIHSFHKKNTSECKDCNSKGGLNRYYDKKVMILNRREIYYGKNRNRLLQRQNKKYIYFEELLRTYVELQNGLIAMEEIFTIKDSEKN